MRTRKPSTNPPPRRPSPASSRVRWSRRTDMPKEPTRRVDVDWLRVFATYLLFPFHAAMVFNPAPFYHVRNADLSMGMLVFTGFVSLWHMPLFFLLAGWSIVASL